MYHNNVCRPYPHTLIQLDDNRSPKIVKKKHLNQRRFRGFQSPVPRPLQKTYEPIPKGKLFFLISRPQRYKEFRTHGKEKRQELDIMTNLCELRMGGINWNNLKKSNYNFFYNFYNSFALKKKKFFLSKEYRQYE